VKINQILAAAFAAIAFNVASACTAEEVHIGVLPFEAQTDCQDRNSACGLPFCADEGFPKQVRRRPGARSECLLRARLSGSRDPGGTKV
jgi:hypothetical protein